MLERLHQLCVRGVADHQLVVGAVGDHHAVGEVEHLVCECDGGRARGDGDDRRVDERRTQVGQHTRLGGGVERRGGVVEEQQLRTPDQRPSECDALSLSTRQAHPALTHDRSRAVGEVVHERRLGSGQGLVDRLVGERQAECDVVAHRAGEEERLLEDDRHRAVRHGDGAPASGDEAGDGVDQRGLARPRCTDHGHRPAPGDVGGDTAKHVTFAVMADHQVGDVDRSARPATKSRSGIGFDRRVQQLSQPRPARLRVRHLAEREPDDPQREHEQREEVDEAGQLADRQRTGAHPVGAADEETDVDEARYAVDERLERAPQTHGLQPRLPQPGGDDGEPFGLASFGPERLDHVHAVEALVYGGAEVADLGLCSVEVPVDAPLVVQVEREQHREHDDGGHAEHRIGGDEPDRREHEHDHHTARERQRLQHGGRRLGVDTGAGDQVSGALAAVPRRRLFDHPVDDLSGERLGDAPPGATGPRAPHHHTGRSHHGDQDEGAEHSHDRAGGNGPLVEPRGDHVVGDASDDLGGDDRACGEHGRAADSDEEQPPMTAGEQTDEVERSAQRADAVQVGAGALPRSVPVIRRVGGDGSGGDDGHGGHV